MTPGEARLFDPAGVVIAVLLAALSGAIFFDTSTLEITSVYGMGPKAMAYVVAGGLAVLAVLNLMMGLAGRLPSRESADVKAILLILGGFAALIALIRFGGGFIPATAVLFVATSTAFGRRAVLTDLLIGLVLAVLIFLMFDKVLTLGLPEGPLERLL